MKKTVLAKLANLFLAMLVVCVPAGMLAIAQSVTVTGLSVESLVRKQNAALDKKSAANIAPPPGHEPPSVNEEDFINKVVYPAVVLLYEQDEQGGMNMLCTATAIEKTAKGYIFVTAAHCASKDDTEHKKVEPEVKKFFYVTLDEAGDKTFIKASLQFCGYQHEGDDFCLFNVDSEHSLPIVPLGKDPASHAAEPIVNVASPLGLGKQVFRGTISSPKLDRPVLVDDINWTNAILLQLPGTNGGSSGSAIVCTNQRAICGFLVGVISVTEIVAVPVSKLHNLQAKIKAGTYKYWKPEDAAGMEEDRSKKVAPPKKSSSPMPCTVIATTCLP